MKKRIYIYSLFLFIIDFIVKRIITSTLELNNSIKIIKDFFYLTYVRNTGAAFSILKDQRMLILLITVIIIYLIDKYLKNTKLRKLEFYSYTLILGGILGNLFDRLYYGYVIDYFDFKIFSYNFAIFNLADTFIVVGAILLLTDTIFLDKEKSKIKKEELEEHKLVEEIKNKKRKNKRKENRKKGK